MKSIQQIAVVVACLALTAGIATGAWWLVTHHGSPGAIEKSPAPANVAKLAKEEDLNTIVLTPEADKRVIGKIGTVTEKPLRRVRVYGGEVMVPMGQAVLVAAPLGGMLKAPTGGIPKVGHPIESGQAVFLLLPLLTPEGRTSIASAWVDADGQVNSAKTQLEATRIALDRAKRLLKEDAGSQRNVDEAQAAHDLAAKSLEAASARRTMLAKVVGEIEAGTASPIRIDAPHGGILRALSALPGQNVPSGAALFEIVDLSKLWVRVALPVGDLPELARTEPVQVGSLAATPGKKFFTAQPVVAPPSANPVSATVDVYYEVKNDKDGLVPGQRLGVTIPLNDTAQIASVPWSAVAVDIHGGTWVYESTAPQTYVRRRVVVKYVLGTDAAISAGPAVGTKIVAEGAQELFGAETSR